MKDAHKTKDELINELVKMRRRVAELEVSETKRQQVEEELKQTSEKLRRAMRGTIYAMALAVEVRDPYTAGHQRKVADLACAIAREMGLSEDQIEGISLAGAIHDVGRIYIPVEILSKPSRLTDIEFSIVKTHPKAGYDILKMVEFPWPIAQIVLQHHERMDGSGYPEGLSGKDIMLEARVLAAADVIDAMASPRPYRSARSIDKALEEISQDKGVLYDPEVVDACLKLFAEKSNKELEKRVEQRTRKFKESQAELIQSERMAAMETMVAGIAHELNNPMMGIVNFIQYCLDYTPKEDKRYRVLQDAERETERCINILQNLSTFSYMRKEGKEARQKESCAVILDRVFKLLSYRIEKEQAAITQHYAEGTPKIWMKTNSIQQVFFNIIGNALDFLRGSERREIHVDVHRKGAFVQVTIADSGCGIASENLQKIFEPFFTTKSTGEGRGLGLSICQSIIEEHGGKITCESKLSTGTKFKILLPIERRK